MPFSDKLIINAAITGMVPTKGHNAHVPVTVEEIVADARRCADAGAAILHLHARDEEGRGTYRADIYGRILRGVREACPEVILCVSTSGRIHRKFEERSAVLELGGPKPEMASLTLGSMNFAREESVNPPEMIRRLGGMMKERGIVPELEIFELGMAEFAAVLVKEGILGRALYANILLGSMGTLSASAMNLEMVVRALPAGTIWAGGGIGRFQFEVNCLAIAMGGHVRVGLEDNLWMDREKREPASNVRLIERVVGVGRAMGRAIATPGEARQMIGLSPPR